MIKQYLKQAFRLLGENKLLSVISIIGTALAICMVMVIVILYIAKTAGFRPEVNRDRTYYLSVAMSVGKDDGRRLSFGSIGLPLIRECYYPLECAEVTTAIIRDRWNNQSALSMDGLKSSNGKVIQTDPAFWKLFSFDFIEGKPFTEADFESGIRTVVLSEHVARALFGSEQAVGKEMKLNFNVFRVCGVVKDVSRFANTAWAEMWIPYTAGTEYNTYWSEGINGHFNCCVLLKEGVTEEELRREVQSRIAKFNSTLSDCKADIGYQPNSQIVEWLNGGNEGKADMAGAFLRYGIILFILLLVPAFNLSGITLSRMRKRIAELGVRRAFGTSKGNIVGQVLFENLVFTLVGGLLGLCFSYVAIWLLRDWLLVTSLGNAGLSGGMLNGYVFLAAFLFCLVMNLMSAGIPAWRVSQVNIIDSINN